MQNSNQYSNYHSNNNNNYHETVLSLIEHIFSDQFIYSHPDMLQLLQKNPKGFIPIAKLIKLQSFQKLAQHNQHLILTYQQIVNAIQSSTSSSSRTLISQNYQIKRVNKFVNKFKSKQILPTLIQNFPKGTTEERIRELLEQITRIYGVFFRGESLWCVAFSEEPALILQGIQEYNRVYGLTMRAYKVQQSLQAHNSLYTLHTKYLTQTIHKNNTITKNIYLLKQKPLPQEYYTYKRIHKILTRKKHHKDHLLEFQSKMENQNRKNNQQLMENIGCLKKYDNQPFIGYMRGRYHVQNQIQEEF